MAFTSSGFRCLQETQYRAWATVGACRQVTIVTGSWLLNAVLLHGLQNKSEPTVEAIPSCLINKRRVLRVAVLSRAEDLTSFVHVGCRCLTGGPSGYRKESGAHEWRSFYIHASCTPALTSLPYLTVLHIKIDSLIPWPQRSFNMQNSISTPFSRCPRHCVARHAPAIQRKGQNLAA